jgi:hypothetical protein
MPSVLTADAIKIAASLKVYVTSKTVTQLKREIFKGDYIYQFNSNVCFLDAYSRIV